VARRDHRRITSTDLGFILGPRLNAAGRLDDMSLGIECLLCEDEALAQDMAQQLDDLNQDRKSIEQGMQREALAQLKDLPVESMPYGLCLFDADWHQGVIGILASRLKERYHRPTIAFAELATACSRARRVRCRASISATRWMRWRRDSRNSLASSAGMPWRRGCRCLKATSRRLPKPLMKKSVASCVRRT
jgi:exonuclease RecJ (EC 3.1.-.-)